MKTTWSRLIDKVACTWGRPGAGPVPRRFEALAALLLLASSPTTIQGASSSELLQSLGLSRADISRLDRGETLGRLLPAKDDREIGVMGAVRIKASKDDFLSWYRNVNNLRDSPVIEKVGVFHDPPGAGDVEHLSFDASDLSRIETCKRGQCSLKLSLTEMDRYRRINWSGGAEAVTQANELTRSILLDF